MFRDLDRHGVLRAATAKDVGEKQGFFDAVAAAVVPHFVGLGQTAGRVFRLGHMGNLTEAQIFQALEGVEKTLASMGRTFEGGLSRTAAASVLAR